MKAFLGVAAVVVLLLAGCGGSERFNVDERFSAEIGAKSVCREEGFEEIAGEREMTYTCSFGADDINHTHVAVCVVIVDSEFYVARHEAC